MIILIETHAGKSMEVKKKIAEAVTEAVARIMKSEKDNIQLIFHELDDSCYFIGGRVAKGLKGIKIVE